MTNAEIINAYRSALYEHKLKYPTFNLKRFDASVKGIWRMKQVIENGVATVNKAFTKARQYDRYINR